MLYVATYSVSFWYSTMDPPWHAMQHIKLHLCHTTVDKNRVSKSNHD
jgi:hypothetical protein